MIMIKEIRKLNQTGSLERNHQVLIQVIMIKEIRKAQNQTRNLENILTQVIHIVLNTVIIPNKFLYKNTFLV